MPAPVESHEWLPDLLRRMAGALGLGVALRMAAEFGGREITLPARAATDHPIARRVSLPALRWLLRTRQPGEKLVVPLGPHSSYRARIAAVRRLIDEGVPSSQIVQRLRCHERTVRRHRATLRQAPKLPLFDR